MIVKRGDTVPKLNKDFNKYEYDKQYHKTHYYRLNVVLPKEMRAVIDEAVKASGLSKNAFIKEAILEKIGR